MKAFDAGLLTFLAVFCSHCRTTSSAARVSGDSKYFTLGLPSFLGPKAIMIKKAFRQKQHAIN